MTEQQQPESAAPGASRLDFQLGVAVAIVAALVAVVDLASGKIGDDEVLATEEKTSAYLWYQSKSIKEAVAENQRDLLRSLVEAGAIADAQKAGVNERLRAVESDVARYGVEKRAILEGGEIDGAVVVGARAHESTAKVLARTGDLLDVSMLFLHLALLLGGVGVAVQHKQLERTLLRLVVAAAGLGVVLAGVALGSWLIG